MKKTSSKTTLLLAIIIGGVLMYFSNLHWLSMYDKPNLRGNHVGLTALTGLVFFGLFFSVRWIVRKKL